MLTDFVEYRVVDARQPLAIHLFTYSLDRCEHWAKTAGKQFYPDTEFKFQGRRAGHKFWEDIQ